MEELYNELIEHIDAPAERIRSIGGRPIGTLHGYLSHSYVKEFIDRAPARQHPIPPRLPTIRPERRRDDSLNRMGVLTACFY